MKKAVVLAIVACAASSRAQTNQEAITASGTLTLTLNGFSNSLGSGTYLQRQALDGANTGEYSNNASQLYSYGGRVTGSGTQTIAQDLSFFTSGAFPTTGASGAAGHGYAVGGGILLGSNSTSLVADFTFRLSYSAALTTSGPPRPDGNFSLIFRYGAYSLDPNSPLFAVDVPITSTFAASRSWSGVSTHGGALFVPRAGTGYYNAFFGLYFVESLPAKPVPEPTSCAVLGLGALGLLRRRRRP